MDFIKKHKRLSILIFIVILAFPFINMIISKLFNADRSELLMYYSAIIGGTLTLGGVAWTIQHERLLSKEEMTIRDKERKEELALQYKPIITFLDLIIEQFHSDGVAIRIYFKNIGRGEATNIETNLKLLSLLDIETPHVIHENEETYISKSDIITVDESVSILINEDYKTLEKSSGYQLTVSYDDFLGNTYSRVFTLDILINDIYPNSTMDLKIKDIRDLQFEVNNYFTLPKN